MDARITRVAPDVRSALHSMGYFWSVLHVVNDPNNAAPNKRSKPRVRRPLGYAKAVMTLP
jgi:hypothetical protein